jgi:dTDP-4-dehydrorhamnose 3,5-epimerase
MSLHIEDTPLGDVKVVHTARHADPRGWFTELWNESRYRHAGLDIRLVQHNASWSKRGVLRGMHFQWPRPQGKLITVVRGSIFDVAIDVRTDSETFGRWYGCELSEGDDRPLWVPAGFAHGFLVLSADALVQYGCTAHYDASVDRALRWDDPRVGIRWPHEPACVSQKDSEAPTLAELLNSGALPSRAAAGAGLGS